MEYYDFARFEFLPVGQRRRATIIIQTDAPITSRYGPQPRIPEHWRRMFRRIAWGRKSLSKHLFRRMRRFGLRPVQRLQHRALPIVKIRLELLWCIARFRQRILLNGWPRTLSRASLKRFRQNDCPCELCTLTIEVLE